MVLSLADTTISQNLLFSISKGHNSKNTQSRNPELRFLCSACCLMLLYICVKFHENISNVFGVTERTRFCDRQTDRRPEQKQDVSQPYGGAGGGRHKYKRNFIFLRYIEV